MGCDEVVDEIRGGVDVLFTDSTELGTAEWLNMLVAEGARPGFWRGINIVWLFAEGEKGCDEFVGHRSCGERLTFIEPTNRKRNKS